MKLVAFALCALISTVCNAESEWRTSWDGMMYGYANSTGLRNDSPFAPVVAQLTRNNSTGDLRLNLKTENDRLRLTLRPILLAQDNGGQAYLSQWQLRLRASDAWSIAAGRELLNWGPAQFRSPSSPFYFDNGRSNPMRELSGVDALKLSWNPDTRHTLTLAHIAGSGHVAKDSWRNSWLLKADQRGEDWATGLVAVKTQNRPAFFGAYGQLTMNDMLLVYTEISSSTRANALNSPADTALPFSVITESPRKLTGLAGLSYTFEDGRSLAAEYLHDAHGYTAPEEQAYFRRAITLPALALGLAPALLGRDYIHLVWQSNMMESNNYWRLMLTHSLTDSGNELAGYAEYSLDPRISAFLLGALPAGSASQEFSSLFRYNITAGLKFALP